MSQCQIVRKPALTVYNNPASSNGWRVSSYLKHRPEIKHEAVVIDLSKNEQHADSYVSKFPRHQIPAAEFKKTPLWESVSIILFLESQFPEGNLTPTKPADYATALTRIGELQNKLESKNFLFSILFLGKKKEDLTTEIAALKEELKVWERHLEGKDYLANTLSFADFAVFPNVAVARALGLSKTDYPNLHAWLNRLGALDSVASTDIFEHVRAFFPIHGVTNEIFEDFLA